jgi:hypothetical protein
MEKKVHTINHIEKKIDPLILYNYPVIETESFGRGIVGVEFKLGKIDYEEAVDT